MDGLVHRVARIPEFSPCEGGRLRPAFPCSTVRGRGAGTANRTGARRGTIRRVPSSFRHDLPPELVDGLVRPFVARLHDDGDETMGLLESHVGKELVPTGMPFDREQDEVVAAATSPARRPNVVDVQPLALDPKLPITTGHVRPPKGGGKMPPPRLYSAHRLLLCELSHEDRVSPTWQVFLELCLVLFAVLKAAYLTHELAAGLSYPDQLPGHVGIAVAKVTHVFDCPPWLARLCFVGRQLLGAFGIVQKCRLFGGYHVRSCGAGHRLTAMAFV